MRWVLRARWLSALAAAYWVAAVQLCPVRAPDGLPKPGHSHAGGVHVPVAKAEAAHAHHAPESPKLQAACTCGCKGWLRPVVMSSSAGFVALVGRLCDSASPPRALAAAPTPLGVAPSRAFEPPEPIPLLA